MNKQCKLVFQVLHNGMFVCVELHNCSMFSVRGYPQFWRLGDIVSPELIDKIAPEPSYEVVLLGMK